MRCSSDNNFVLDHTLAITQTALVCDTLLTPISLANPILLPYVSGGLGKIYNYIDVFNFI